MTRAFLAAAFILTAILLQADPIDEARVQYREKNYEAARVLLEGLTQREPDNAEAWYWLGRSFRKEKKAVDAVRCQDAAIRLQSKESRYWIGLGDAYGEMAKSAPLFDKLGFARKCHDALAQAVKLAPESLEARSALIDFCRQAPEIAGGGSARAYAEVEAFKQINLEGATQLQVPLLMKDRRFEEALDVCEVALEKHPHSYAMNFSFGRTAAITGFRAERGIDRLRHCLQLEVPPDWPGHGAVWARLGDLYSRTGDKGAAREAYAKAVELDPSLTEASDKLKALPQE